MSSYDKQCEIQVSTFSSLLRCVNAMPLSTLDHSRDAVRLLCRAPFLSIVVASDVCHIVAALCRAFFRSHVAWEVMKTSTVGTIIPAEYAKVDTHNDGGDNDSDDDSNTRDNVWRSSQLASTLHIWRRRVAGPHCSIHACNASHFLAPL